MASSTTRIVTVRIPNDVYEKIEKRVKKSNITMSAYLKDRIVYDVNRKHRKRK